MVGSFKTVPVFYWGLPETDALLSAVPYFPLEPNKNPGHVQMDREE